jgi:hypothetical protein
MFLVFFKKNASSIVLEFCMENFLDGRSCNSVMFINLKLRFEPCIPTYFQAIFNSTEKYIKKSNFHEFSSEKLHYEKRAKIKRLSCLRI